MASNSNIHKIHKTLTQMQKNLECSICLELLKDPVLTKCEHHFCNFCILALLQSKRRSSSAPCPLCKEPITKRSLTTHSTLKGIVTSFQNVVAAIEQDTGQKCTPPRGPLPFSQPEPPSQRPKRPEKKVEKKSNVRRGKAKSVPAIPIYLDDEEEEPTLVQSSPLKNNINIVSSFPSPRNSKKNAKKLNSSKDKENTQQSETEEDHLITGQSDILEVIANESLGQNGTRERTKGTETGQTGVSETQSINKDTLQSRVNIDKCPGKDPYEFIASQRTPRKLKKRRVKEKKKKPWEYSFGKISRKKKEEVGDDSDRWAESQSGDDYDDGGFVHREDIESDEEKEEDGNEGDNARKERSGRKEENANENQKGQEMVEEQMERIDSSDEEGLEEADGRNGEVGETSVRKDAKEVSDLNTGVHRGRKEVRNAASKAMDAMKGQITSQSSGSGSASTGADSCHGDKDTDVIDITEDSYGRSLIDFGKVHKDKAPSIDKTEVGKGHLNSKGSEIPSPGLKVINGHISQEFPLSQPPKLNRNHGDKLFAKAYGRGKAKNPGEGEEAPTKMLENDDDLPDVINLDVGSDEEGKGYSQELFLEDVLDPTPQNEFGRTVIRDSVDDGNFNMEGGRIDDKEEAIDDGENVGGDVCSGMLEEVEGQFDDSEMETGASHQIKFKNKDKSEVEEPTEDACLQLGRNGMSSREEKTDDLKMRETLEENITEGESKKEISERQHIDVEEGERDVAEDSATGDEDEVELRRGKKRESLKGKMRNKDGLKVGETENIVQNDPEEHLQSDWELALKLAQEFGSVPPNLDVSHSKQVNNKNEKGSGRRGRKMRQLQIQNVPDAADRGQNSRKTRIRRNLRSNVADDIDDVEIESFQDDSRGDGSGKSKKKARQAKNESQVNKNVKNSRVDEEKEESSVQCVPETPHVSAKLGRGSLSDGKKETVDKRKIELDEDVESEFEDRESKRSNPIRGCKVSVKKVSEGPKKLQKLKSSGEENGCSEQSKMSADGGEDDDRRYKEGRRKSSRLSKSQEENIKSGRVEETEFKEKVDSDAEMKGEAKKDMTPKGRTRKDGKEKRKSARLSKSQEETKSDERKDGRKSYSEAGVGVGSEAERVVIVIDDGSDVEGAVDDLGQGKRMSARLLTKSQEKKVEQNVVRGDSIKRKTGEKSQGRTRKKKAASLAEEEKINGKQILPNDHVEEREKTGQKRRSLRNKKEDDDTLVDRKDEEKTPSQYSGKTLEMSGDDGSKEDFVSDSDAVPSLQKHKKEKNVRKETAEAFSGSTTESINLDSNSTFAQSDKEVSSEQTHRNKKNVAEKAERKRKAASEENLILSEVDKEKGSGNGEIHSFEENRQLKRKSSEEIKEAEKIKKSSFSESKKKFSEHHQQKKLVQEKERGEKDEDVEGDLVNEESDIDAEMEKDGPKDSVGLGKSKLRSRSSGRRGRITPGMKNFKDGSSSVQEEAEEQNRRSTRRRRKDVSVKGQAEDETNKSVENEPGEKEACETIEIVENEEQKRKDGQREKQPKVSKDADIGKVDERDEKSVEKNGDPTSPDIFTMHLEASEQERRDSIRRSKSEEEAKKEETGTCMEGDGGETPKTSKRKKKKRKTFSFGNEGNLEKGSLTDDPAGVNVRGEAEELTKGVSNSESATEAGLELAENGSHNKGGSYLGEFVPATEGASETQDNFKDQIPIPRQFLRGKDEESRRRCKVQNENCEKEDLTSEEVVSVKRVSSLKSRGKRQVAKNNEELDNSRKRFCSDSQFSLNSGEEESMVPPTPPVTASLYQTDADGESGSGSKCNSHKEETLVQAFEKVKGNEDKASGSNQEDKIASSLSSPSISLFQDIEMTTEQEVVEKAKEKVAEQLGGKTSPETGTGVSRKEVKGKRESKRENDSGGSSPEDLPDVLGEDAASGIKKDGVMPETSKNNDADLNKDEHEEEDKDTFVQPYNKQYDEEEPLFDDDYPVSPASSIGRHNLTSASSVLSSQSDLMTSQQQDNAKKVLENMEKEMAEMERALAEDGDEEEIEAASEKDGVSDEDENEEAEKAKSEQQDDAERVLENIEQEIADVDGDLAENEEAEKVEAVGEKKDEVSDEDEEEVDGKGRRKVTKGEQQRRGKNINTSQETYAPGKLCGPPEGVESINFEGVDSISLSSDEDEKECPNKQSKKDRVKKGKTSDRRSSGYGKTVLKKYGKYQNLEDIDDKVIAQNVKETLSEMAEAEKSLDSLLKAHAARREENDKEGEEVERESCDSGDEDVDIGRPSTPPAVSPSSSPPRSPSPAPLLSQRTLTRRLSPLQKDIQKAEEIVKNFSEERPAASQKRKRVVIEDSDSESEEEEVQYKNKRKKSLKLDSPESYEGNEENVKGHSSEQKAKSPCNIRSPSQGNRKAISPKTSVGKRDIKAVENLQKVSPKVGGMQNNSPERKKVTTPQTSSSGSGGSSNKKKPRKGEMMSLVATGLNKHKLKMVDQLCKKAGCKFSSVFIPSTTHIIVNTGENLTCERTLKYFQGIAAKRWVISFQWVQDSLSASRLLPLEKYEIRGDTVNGQNHCGPRRARLWKGPPLLGDYNMFCLEPFTGLNKEQLEGLLKACGGTVYQHPSEIPQEDGKENLIIAQHDVQEEEKDYQALYEKYQVKVISREWVLDSIAVYTTQPITDYLLCDVTECDDAEDLMSDDEF